MHSYGPSATLPGSAEPTAVTHVLPTGWRIVIRASGGFLFCLVVFALLLPRLDPDPGSIFVGFLLGAFVGPLVLLVALNPVASRIVRDVDGLTAHVRGSTTFLAWQQLVGIRDRGVLGQVELIAADGTTIRLSHKTEGLVELLMHALEHIAPRPPATFRGSAIGPAIGILLLGAIPASIHWRDGVLMAAWVAAAFGVVAFLTSLRSIRLTTTGVELKRTLGRRIVPLRAIGAIGIHLPRKSGRIVVVIGTREGEELMLDLPDGRILLFFGALDRELRRIHGDDWGALGASDEVDGSIDIDAVLKEYRERGGVDAAS